MFGGDIRDSGLRMKRLDSTKPILPETQVNCDTRDVSYSMPPWFPDPGPNFKCEEPQSAPPVCMLKKVVYTV